MKFLRITFYSICGLILLLGCLLIGHLHADSPALIITEIKVRNDTEGYDEFIELFNPGSEPVSLNNYFIGYINTPNPTISQAFDRSVIGQGQLEAGQYFLLAKNELDPHLPLAQKSPFSSLSDSGGTVQLSDEAGNVVDEVRWSSTVSVATGTIVYMPGTTQGKSQTITRSKTQDLYEISPANWQLASPTPESHSLLPLPPELIDPVDQSDPPSESLPAETDSTDTSELPSLPQTMQSRDIEISEVLPNPAPPATDEADEFIELHNISSAVVNLKDYTLQSGNNFTYSYIFPDHELKPDAYEIFTVLTTHLLLSNSGGRSRLLSPTGEVVSQTETYGAAPAGKAWALIDDVWQWTDTVTPGAANVASTTVGSTKTSTSVPKTSKTTKKAAPTAPKKTPTKAKATSTAKKSNTTTNKKGAASGAPAAAKLHPFILAGVGVSTVLYGLYEYRQDISNTMRRLRGNRSFRRELGSQTQGPGSD